MSVSAEGFINGSYQYGCKHIPQNSLPTSQMSIIYILTHIDIPYIQYIYMKDGSVKLENTDRHRECLGHHAITLDSPVSLKH